MKTILLSVWHLFVGHQYQAAAGTDGKIWVYGVNTDCGTFTFACACGHTYQEFIL